ncbi:hypothetical protein T439DRAFT_328224 [Meredithblackwellia eburnea MCA 4105]
MSSNKPLPAVTARDFELEQTAGAGSTSLAPSQQPSSTLQVPPASRTNPFGLPSQPLQRPKAPSLRLSFRDDVRSSRERSGSIGGGSSIFHGRTPPVGSESDDDNTGGLARLAKAKTGRVRSATVGAISATKQFFAGERKGEVNEGTVRPGEARPDVIVSSADPPSQLARAQGRNQGEEGDDTDAASIFTAGGRRRALSVISWRRWTPDARAERKEEREREKEVEAEKEQRRLERQKHDQQVIDLLDVIDPEVGTLTTLSDVQNSLFVPDLGRWVDRTRYLRLTKPPSDEPSAVEGAAEVGATADDAAAPKRRRRAPSTAVPSGEPTIPEDGASIAETTASAESAEVALAHIEARGKYLVLPEGMVDWEHWTDKEREELDDYVRHLLHSKKWKAKRGWRGFKQYFRTPLGAFVTIYASLLTFWGAAWILFIIGWLHAGDRQAYFVEICDQILTALFCVVGIGLAPFRAVDTYHMIFIAKYHRKALRLWKEQGEPPLPDENDLPDPTVRVGSKKWKARTEGQAEEAYARKPVLTVKEQATFIYHQQKFSKSHTFYRPHETFTHKAFPLDLLIVVVCLLDFHSIFQIALGSSTWSISYHHNYKKILTSIILSFSISCNITAGLVIAVGNRRTRKQEVVRELLHKAVTEEAVKRKQAKEDRRRKELEEEKRKLVQDRDRPFLG